MNIYLKWIASEKLKYLANYQSWMCVVTKTPRNFHCYRNSMLMISYKSSLKQVGNQLGLNSKILKKAFQMYIYNFTVLKICSFFLSLLYMWIETSFSSKICYMMLDKSIKQL